MNRKNIYATIEILHHAQNFDIRSFQERRKKDECYDEGHLRNPLAPYAQTIEQLHQCGNTACIGGYVALSEAWRDFGGHMAHGQPHLRKGISTLGATRSMAAFWDLPYETAEAVIYGEEFEDFCEKHGITGMPEKWAEMTKDNAISLFEQLLALDEQGVAL